MSDLSERIAMLSHKKRALFERLLRDKKVVDTLMMETRTRTVNDHYDVIILGGGLAGSTLARQLKRARPETRILVVEKRKYPAPEAAFKVGESTVEIGAHYFSEVLGMKEHLQMAQLPKLGLRFFFSADDNTDIAQRVEIGPFAFLPVPAYQLDRGRFENALAVENVKHGIDLLDACKGSHVAFGEEKHTVTLSGEEERTVTARWVVDASGRGSLLKRQLGLAQEADHDVNAIWFRLDKMIDIGTWSNDAKWQNKSYPGLRRLSTNHVMGEGYWVWFIPLASGSISVGIVADAKLYPFNTINRFERALKWLWEHEPQCAKAVEDVRDSLQDFCVLKHYAHSCKQVFSADRWSITGEAGLFHDPLYSHGSDLIAVSNTFITDLITREFAGEDIRERVDRYNDFFINHLFDVNIKLFQKQYPLMGNAQVMTAKIIWDITFYWGMSVPLFTHNVLCELDFMSSIKGILARAQELHTRMQAFFREWDALGRQEWTDASIDYGSLKFLYHLNCGILAGMELQELRSRLSENLGLLETLAAKMFHKAAGLLPVPPAKNDINPYVICLDPEQWREDSLYADFDRNPVTVDIDDDLTRAWLDSLMEVAQP